MSTIRIPVAVGVAAAVTALLIRFMFEVVLGSAPATLDIYKRTSISFDRVQRDCSAQFVPRERLVVRPDPTWGGCGTLASSVLDLAGPVAPEPIKTVWQNDLQLPSFEPVRLQAPLARADPIYPHNAIVRELSGWVHLQFDVSESGATQNVRVLAAEPRGVFERSAIKAVSGWRYTPRIVDGRTESVEGLRVKVVFKLE